MTYGFLSARRMFSVKVFIFWNMAKIQRVFLSGHLVNSPILVVSLKCVQLAASGDCKKLMGRRGFLGYLTTVGSAGFGSMQSGVGSLQRSTAGSRFAP